MSIPPDCLRDGLPFASDERHVVRLSPGDTVLFATDGLYETCDPQGRQFGEAGLNEVWAQCFRRSAYEALEWLLEHFHAFASGAGASDDVTVVVLKVPR